MFKIFHKDNMDFHPYTETGVGWFDLIYNDCIYESRDFSWVDKYWLYLKKNGIFIIQTDWHTQHLYRVLMEEKMGATFVNHLVWKCEWGRQPSDKYHQCYDDILIYCKGDNWRFDRSTIQVPKATAKSKGLNPSGRDTKTATAWIDDIVLTTVAKERIKKEDGHLIRWQKPVRLMDRILSPFLRKNDIVLDPFMGSGSTGESCGKNGWNYVGIEIDEEPFELATVRLEHYFNDEEYIPF